MVYIPAKEPGECCRRLLSEGLDLCVRARKFDEQDRANVAVDLGVSDIERYAERHNALYPDQPCATKCGTVALWVQDQYERDLADWERRTRHHLTQGCTPTPQPKEQPHGQPS